MLDLQRPCKPLLIYGLHQIRGKTSGADDYTMLFATGLAIALSGISIEAVQDGKGEQRQPSSVRSLTKRSLRLSPIGRHYQYLSDNQIATVSMLSWVNQIILFCALCMIKTSICLLILRIKDSKWVKWVVYTTIALLAISNLIPIIALCVECSPVYGFWRRTADGVSCNKPDFRIYSIWVQSGRSITPGSWDLTDDFEQPTPSSPISCALSCQSS